MVIFAIASGVAGGAVFTGASGLAVTVASGVIFGVASGVIFGPAAALFLGAVFAVVSPVIQSSSIGFSTLFGYALVFLVVFGVVFGVTFSRLILAPFDVVAAWWLAEPLRKGVPLSEIWARHPARWDPHGRFPLPGLTSLLTELQLREPALGVEANRIVAANPTRQRSVAGAALRVVDRTIERTTTVQAFALLANDLAPMASGNLLSDGERAELKLVTEVSQDVAASFASDAVVNRVVRLRAAQRRVRALNLGSALIARHRPRLAALVEEALTAAVADQRQREPVPQVYRASGTPLDLATELRPSTFKGRRSMFERLENLLGTEQRETVIIHGPRRYGKTSLLKQLPGRLGPSVIPVFVDLQAGLGISESAGALLGGLAAAVVEQAQSLRALEGLPMLGDSALGDEPHIAFVRWLNQIEDAVGKRHILLCIDEFQKLQEQIEHGRLDTRILDLIRSIAQHRQRVTVALTGAYGLAELPPIWASTLVNATSIDVGPLERDEAIELIERPVPGFPSVYSPGAVDAILEFTARQPFLVQVLCSVIVEELNRRRWHEGDPLAEAEDVTAVVPRAVERAENYFLDLWRSQVPDAARAFLRELAYSGGAPAIDHSNDDFVEALLALQRRRIVTRLAADFTFVVPLFAEYVRTKQSIR